MKIFSTITFLLTTALAVAQIYETIEKPLMVVAPAEPEIVEIPDKEAEFPGGSDKMMRYISENVRYPQSSIEFNEQGRVFLSFIIEKDGKITNVKVEKGVSDSIDAEALRLVNSMPWWTPGVLKGEPVRTKAMLPINFTLSGTDYEEEDEDAPRKFYDGHWAGFDLGVLVLMNDLFKSDFGSTDYWNNRVITSTVFNFNLFDYKLPIFKQYLGLTTGLGWNVTTIGLSNNYDIIHTADSVLAFANSFQNYRINNLNVQYITIPLLFEFATKKEQKNSFYFAAGVIGGVRIFSNTRKTGKYSNGDFFDITVRSKYNLAPFSLEATARTGYGPVGVFASYNITTLFKEEKTVAVYPFRAGISLNVDYSK